MCLIKRQIIEEERGIYVFMVVEYLEVKIINYTFQEIKVY